MRRRFLSALFLAVYFIVAPSIGAIASTKTLTGASGALRMFDTEGAAQKHCPADEVVWLNIPTGIYHEKGMRWYGRTKHGAFVCKKEAHAAGDRDTRNGQ